nr:YbjQ family protein [Bacillus sp. REN3]
MIRVLVTTTNTLQGKEIERYIGVVTGEAIMGANVVRDFLASVTDVIGGRSSAYENKLAEGRDIALREMEEKAQKMGANAVIGVDLDFETLREGMMMCIATGTAVYIKE